ncbi:MAG: Nif3-like dinuclear metal center hexameric protein, partial [Clostridia bacterium]|nr:Nif3-like dinuclear metal center hexameric protein [Clostridia bacterium]
MELKEFCRVMETIAPREFALEFDNVGLLVEPDHREIRKVLLALDCTTVTAREAIDMGA